MLNEKIGISADEFLPQYFKLVYKQAQKFRNTQYFHDIIQEGMVGLVIAYQTYDPGRGIDFVSHAYKYINGEILHYYRDKTNVIKLPRNFKKIKSVVDENDYTYKDAEKVAVEVGCSAKHVKDVMNVIFNMNVCYGDQTCESDETEIDTFFEFKIGKTDDESKIVMIDFLSLLQGNTLKVALLILNGYNKSDIADIMNVSKPMVSKYIKKIKEKWTEYEK